VRASNQTTVLHLRAILKKSTVIIIQRIDSHTIFTIPSFVYSLFPLSDDVREPMLYCKVPLLRIRAREILYRPHRAPLGPLYSFHNTLDLACQYFRNKAIENSLARRRRLREHVQVTRCYRRVRLAYRSLVRTAERWLLKLPRSDKGKEAFQAAGRGRSAKSSGSCGSQDSRGLVAKPCLIIVLGASYTTTF
jgi:hypothetical protein